MCKITKNRHLLSSQVVRSHNQPQPKWQEQENASLSSASTTNTSAQTTALLPSPSHFAEQLEELPTPQLGQGSKVILQDTVQNARPNSKPQIDVSSSSSPCSATQTSAKTADPLAHFAVDEQTQLSLRAIKSLCLPQRPLVTNEELIRDCLLGRVSTGVYADSNSANSRQVVVKEFDMRQVLQKRTKQGARLHEDALVELQIHGYVAGLKLPHVIQLYGLYLDEPAGKLFSYMEYAEQGELLTLLQAPRSCPGSGMSGLPLSVAVNFFVQLLIGVQALHAVNVVHRDLSLENVLVCADNELKICDFGLATICPPGTKISDGKVIGKVRYMCPELYYGEEYDPRLVDVWSVGVIFFIMITSVMPYELPTAEDPRLVMLCKGHINEILGHWRMAALDQEIVQLFAKIFCPPEQRWQAHQLLQLPICQRFANLPKQSINSALKRQNESHREAQAHSSAESVAAALRSFPSTTSAACSVSAHSSSHSVAYQTELESDTESELASLPSMNSISHAHAEMTDADSDEQTDAAINASADHSRSHGKLDSQSSMFSPGSVTGLQQTQVQADELEFMCPESSSVIQCQQSSLAQSVQYSPLAPMNVHLSFMQPYA